MISRGTICGLAWLVAVSTYADLEPPAQNLTTKQVLRVLPVLRARMKEDKARSLQKAEAMEATIAAEVEATNQRILTLGANAHAWDMGGGDPKELSKLDKLLPEKQKQLRLIRNAIEQRGKAWTRAFSSLSHLEDELGQWDIGLLLQYGGDAGKRMEAELQAIQRGGSGPEERCAELDLARELLSEAATMAKRGIAQAEEARAARQLLKIELSKYDISRLEQHGGSAWEKVQDALLVAERTGAAPSEQRAAINYAKTLLPRAAAVAKQREAQTEEADAASRFLNAELSKYDSSLLDMHGGVDWSKASALRDNGDASGVSPPERRDAYKKALEHLLSAVALTKRTVSPYINRMLIDPDSEGRFLRAHAEKINTLEISADGRYLVSGDSTDIKLWDIHEGKLLHVWKHGAQTAALSFSRTDSRLAMVSPDSNVEIVCIPDTVNAKRLVAHEAPVTAVGFSPADEFLVSCDENGSIACWGLHKEKLMARTQLTGVVPKTICFSPNGENIAVGCNDGFLRIFACPSLDAEDAFPVVFGTNLVAMAGQSDDHWFSCGGATVLSVHTWHKPSAVRPRNRRAQDYRINDIAISADDSILAAACDNGKLPLWRMPGPVFAKQLSWIDEADVTAITFSPKGNQLVCGDASGRILVWEFSPPFHRWLMVDLENVQSDN